MSFLLKGFSTLGFSIPIIKEIFMLIDHVIYLVANLALQSFFEIEELSAELAVKAPQIEYILSRVMVLAGVFALFSVSLRLINYLINPNKVDELKKSSSSVVSRIVIALILLVSIKFIFQFMGDLEHRVFTNQVIPKIVYGPQPSEYNQVGTIKDQSTRFVNNVWLLFYTPKTSCENSNSGGCIIYNNIKNGTTDSILPLVGTNYSEFDYLPIVSGIVGLVLIYYFIRFAIDLGIRIIQMFLLQVISPIPIIMSVDPSRKDQLTKFATTYLGVYTQVFIRVLTFYIAFIAIDLLGALPDSFNSASLLLKTDVGMFVKVILIIGVFQSASTLPKLIEDAIGVKLGIDTSPKGFGGVLKGIIGGSAGLFGGAVAGGLAGGIGGALAGGASGMWNAGIGAAAGRNAAAGVSATVAAIGKSHQLGGNIRGTGGLGMFMLGGGENFFGGAKRDAATLKDFDDKLKGKDDIIKVKDNEIGGINGKIDTRRQSDSLRSALDQTVTSKFDANFGSLQDRLAGDYEYNKLSEDLKKATTESDYNTIYGQREAKKASLEATYNSERQTYYDAQVGLATGRLTGTGLDSDIAQAVKDYNSYVDAHGMADRKIREYADSDRTAQLSKRDVEAYNRAIEKREAEKKTIEAEKKTIEADKIAFTETPEYKRRNQRKEEPEYKPRN